MKTSSILRARWAAVFVLVLSPVFYQCSSAAESPASQDRAAILKTLRDYETALNSSDAQAAAAVYSDDAVVMVPNQQSSVGIEAVRAAYKEGFKNTKLDLKFNVAEVVEVAPSWAFVRTTSKGSIKLMASGTLVPESNKELFIFKKNANGEWKIARYSFSVNEKH